jgi:hypothetical protein
MRSYGVAWTVLAIVLFVIEQTGAFRISAPVSGEVIDVDEYYYMKWNTDALRPEHQVSSVSIESPDYGLLTTESS